MATYTDMQSDDMTSIEVSEASPICEGECTTTVETEHICEVFADLGMVMMTRSSISSSN